MDYKKIKMKTEQSSRKEILVNELCNEIDFLKEERDYYKDLYEKERSQNNKMLNENLERSKKELGNALMFALSTTDDPNGNLVISKENRQKLAKNYKQE
jgi:hypothetical protein